MSSLTLERDLPYRAEQLFDVAAEIERYPEFLPGWQAARIYERDGPHWRVDNIVAVGPLRLQFRTEALLQRPERIEVTCTEAPFERLQLTWGFGPAGGANCHLMLSAQIRMRTLIMQVIVDRTLQGFLSDTVSAFQERARTLYGSAAPP